MCRRYRQSANHGSQNIASADDSLRLKMEWSVSLLEDLIMIDRRQGPERVRHARGSACCRSEVQIRISLNLSGKHRRFTDYFSFGVSISCGAFIHQCPYDFRNYAMGRRLQPYSQEQEFGAVLIGVTFTRNCCVCKLKKMLAVSLLTCEALRVNWCYRWRKSGKICNARNSSGRAVYAYWPR
jgi:hypothetical protein